MPEFVSNNRTLVRATVPGKLGSIGVIGDSVAMSLYPGIAYEGSQRHLATIVAAYPGCPSGTTERVDSNGHPFAWGWSCPRAIIAGQKEMVNVDHVKTVFWLDARDGLDIRVDGTVMRAGSKEWKRALFADWDQTLRRISAGGARVVILVPLQAESAAAGPCSGASEADVEGCAGSGSGDPRLTKAYREWAATHPGTVSIVDLNSVLCPSGSPCPRVVSGVDLRVDGVHFSNEGALVAASALRSLVPDAFR